MFKRARARVCVGAGERERARACENVLFQVCCSVLQLVLQFIEMCFQVWHGPVSMLCDASHAIESGFPYTIQRFKCTRLNLVCLARPNHMFSDMNVSHT